MSNAFKRQAYTSYLTLSLLGLFLSPFFNSTGNQHAVPFCRVKSKFTRRNCLRKGRERALALNVSASTRLISSIRVTIPQAVDMLLHPIVELFMLGDGILYPRAETSSTP